MTNDDINNTVSMTYRILTNQNILRYILGNFQNIHSYRLLKTNNYNLL